MIKSVRTKRRRRRRAEHKKQSLWLKEEDDVVNRSQPQRGKSTKREELGLKGFVFKRPMGCEY